MTLTPAYGRDYKTAKAVKADFDADKDFIIADIFSKDSGRMVNRSQLVGEFKTVNVRFNSNRNVVVIRLEGK